MPPANTFAAISPDLRMWLWPLPSTEGTTEITVDDMLYGHIFLDIMISRRDVPHPLDKINVADFKVDTSALAGAVTASNFIPYYSQRSLSEAWMKVHTIPSTFIGTSRDVFRFISTEVSAFDVGSGQIARPVSLLVYIHVIWPCSSVCSFTSHFFMCLCVRF